MFTPVEHPDYETESYRLLRWKRGPSGRHIELGISEMNLFMLLGMMGLSAELCGQPLIPIGTVYDPFVCRGLDALIYSLYSGAKFYLCRNAVGDHPVTRRRCAPVDDHTINRRGTAEIACV